MRLVVFEKEVASSLKIGENDRLWFRRYALSVRIALSTDLPVNEHAVIRFSKSLLNNGAPAWQRWQAVRAVKKARPLTRRGLVRVRPGR